MRNIGVFLLTAALSGLSATSLQAAGRDDDLSLSFTGDAGETILARQVTPSPTAANTHAGSSDSYRVDTGDGISVTVYGEPDLSIKDERVKGDGTISYPLLGVLQVRGMSAPEVQDLITDRLADGYLKKPNVIVSIGTYRMFFIKGEVRNPGGYNFQNGLTVEKAVALAGGFTERASESAITVYRDGDTGSNARKIGPTTRIRPGDVVTIGESFF